MFNTGCIHNSKPATLALCPQKTSRPRDIRRLMNSTRRPRVINLIRGKACADYPPALQRYNMYVSLVSRFTAEYTQTGITASIHSV